MFRNFAVGVVMLLAACSTSHAQQDENKKPKPNETPEYFGTQKPILCQKTEGLLLKFTEDSKEQLIAQYHDPVHDTGGMIWWNAEDAVIHVIEFPPRQGNEWACVTVFGVNARMIDHIKKKGTRL